MFSKFTFLLRQFVRSIWFRPAVFAIAAVAISLLTPVFNWFIPDSWKALVEAETVDKVLTILASSLLAVAIFSLSTMVAAFRAASNSATPRARPLVIEDNTAQTAVSTFIGAFLFSLIGIIGLRIGLYDQTGVVLLFGLTIALILIVVVILIDWIHTLSVMGDVSEAIERVEAAGAMAFTARNKEPRFGGHPARTPPSDAIAVHAGTPGFVQLIDGEALINAIETHDIEIDVLTAIGGFTDPSSPLACVSAGAGEEACEAVREAFVTGRRRTFTSDPHFALVALSEISMRALSPSLNDAGTAVECVRAIERLLLSWQEDAKEREPDPPHDGLYAPELDPEALLREPFTLIARDGAAYYEVGSTLQGALAGLRDGAPGAFASASEQVSARIMERARTAMDDRTEIERLEACRRECGFG